MFNLIKQAIQFVKTINQSKKNSEENSDKKESGKKSDKKESQYTEILKFIRGLVAILKKTPFRNAMYILVVLLIINLDKVSTFLEKILPVLEFCKKIVQELYQFGASVFVFFDITTADKVLTFFITFFISIILFNLICKHKRTIISSIKKLMKFIKKLFK